MKYLVACLCLAAICLSSVAETKKIKCNLYMMKGTLKHYVSRSRTGVSIMPCPSGTIFSEGHCGCVSLTNGYDSKWCNYVQKVMQSWSVCGDGTVWCDMRPYSGRKYKHWIHGKWRTRYCPAGTTLNQSKCVCDHV